MLLQIRKVVIPTEIPRFISFNSAIQIRVNEIPSLVVLKYLFSHIGLINFRLYKHCLRLTKCRENLSSPDPNPWILSSAMYHHYIQRL